jgi:hypothetical protein
MGGCHRGDTFRLGLILGRTIGRYYWDVLLEKLLEILLGVPKHFVDLKYQSTRLLQNTIFTHQYMRFIAFSLNQLFRGCVRVNNRTWLRITNL